LSGFEILFFIKISFGFIKSFGIPVYISDTIFY
jgi:hypothetical protein